MGSRVYLQLCQKYGVKCADVGYEEVLEWRRMGMWRSGGIGASRQHRRWNIIVQTLLW